LEEVELVADDLVDVLRPEAFEVVDRVAHELALRHTGAGFLDRRERDRLVSLAERDEHCSSDLSCPLDGPEPRERDQQPSGVDLVAPPIVRRQSLESRSASGAAITANAPCAPAIGIVTGPPGNAARVMLHVRRSGHARRPWLREDRKPVGRWCKSDRRSDTRIRRGGHQRESAAEREPPERDPVGIDTLKRAGVLDSSPPVLELTTKRDSASWAPRRCRPNARNRTPAGPNPESASRCA
jgi:hypothetical protein